MSLKAIGSAATFKSAARHVRTVTAVCPDNATTVIYDMVAARLGCRLIAFFLFIFVIHHDTSNMLHFSTYQNCNEANNYSLINQMGTLSTVDQLKAIYPMVAGISSLP
jgi:hypothetical protein